MMKQTLTAILLFLLTGINLFSQNSDINFRIKNLSDSIVYLGSYYGNKSVVADTAQISDNSTVVFQSKEPLPGGIYFLVNSGKEKLFEFVIDRDQQFKITTDTGSFIQNAEIKGSQENELFFEYVTFTNELHDSVTIIRNKLKQKNISADSAVGLNRAIARINNKVIKYKENFLQQYPEHTLSLVFNVIRQPEIPDSVRSMKDPGKEYSYFKNHYWDDINFTDERLLRIPGFYDKLHTWYSKVVPQHPDSITKEIDNMLDKAEGNPEVYNYLIWYFIEQYDQEKIMGFDKIFVHVAEKYFTDNELINTSKSVKNQILDRANKLKGILIGTRAPNMILLDTNNKFRSFLDIEAEYTIIFFWDQDCGVCKEEINVLKEIMDTTNLDMEIFAVCTDTNLSAWKKKIEKYDITNWVHTNATRSVTSDYHELYDVYGTPLIFVLNRRKEIIAKKISAEQIVPYLYKVKNRR